MKRVTIELTRDQAQALFQALDDAWEYLDWIADERDRGPMDEADVVDWRAQRHQYAELQRLLTACIGLPDTDSRTETPQGA